MRDPIFQFKVDGDNIDFLSSPDEFHKILCEKIKASNDRVVLSALYLSATTEKEKEIVNAISTAQAKNPALKPKLLFDYNRMLRKTSQGGCCLQQLSRQLSIKNNNAESDVKIFLFRHPKTMNKMLRIIDKISNEVFIFFSSFSTWYQ
jgi:phosphatidylserine/phosphatidylglycerophosphate/cardiolipin synthase-like enzyme